MDSSSLLFSHSPSRPPSEVGQDARLLALLDTLPDAILCVNRKWEFTYANQEAKRLSRMEDGDLEGRTLWDKFPEIAPETAPRYFHAMASGTPDRFDLFYPPFAMHFDVRLIPSSEGLTIYYRDVSEQKLTELREADAQRRLAQAMEATSDAVFSLDPQWCFTFLNSRAKQLLDSGDRLVGTNIWEEFPAARTGDFWDHYHRTMDEGVPSEFDAYYPVPLDKWFTVRSQPAENGIVVFFSDITERKKQVEALAASEERYRVLADLNPQAIWMGDAAGNITYANHGFLAYIGLDTSHLSNGGWLNAFHESERARVVEVWSHSVKTGNDYQIEALIYRAPTQEYRYWNLRAAPVRASSGEILHWLGVGSDIHDEKTATAALRAEKAETEKRNAEIEAVYQNTPIGLALFEPVEFRFLSLNDAEADIIGLPKEQILGQKLADVAPIPEVLALFARVAKGEGIRDHLLEGELPSRPGEKRAWKVNYLPVFAEDGSVRAIVNASTEITHQRRAEAALMQSEKLAAVGRLASSISHEINNPLEAITNLLYLIVNNPGLPEDLKIYVNMASSELSRVSQIATQSLRFHRQAVAETHVTAAELVDAVVKLYTGRLANSGIRLEARYATQAKVLCFENDIRQVLNNLIANSIDAMRGGGRLVIRAHNAQDGKGRSGVRITIADTGHGMSPQTAARIFEPFFTTKDLNGTGLGLWISSGIVERHQGSLRVRSSTALFGHGTAFSLFLPLHPGAGE